MKKLLAAFAMSMFFCLTANATETIILASHYNYLPWVADDGSGLNADLARRLSEMSGGKYLFKAETFPRRRLDRMLANGEKLVVPWVNPQFFGDKEKTKFLWSSALMSDVSYFVSPASAPLEYSGPESLHGKKFSGMLGHVYGDLAPLIDSGKVLREDAPSLRESLRKLVSNRGLDFSVVDRSTLVATKGEPYVAPSQIYISKRPRFELFTRHILVPKSHPEWLVFINKALADLRLDRSWAAEMQRYGSNEP